MHYIVISCLLFISVSICANETRRSSSNICHERGHSPYFDNTSKRFTFETVEACLASIENARLPKSVEVINAGKVALEVHEDKKLSLESYNRKNWPHWKRNQDGCLNTRNAILKKRSLTPVTIFKCSVKQGRWHGIYLDKYFTQSSDVDIDHIVPLKAAHLRGGYAWSQEQKEQFANDPENLLIVDDATNQAKGAKTPVKWMPPNQQYGCKYLSNFDRIMKKYDLKYLRKEKIVNEKMKKKCSK